MRERQLMAAEAGPSGAGELEEFEELQEPPFPEPVTQPMALCDLLGMAAELEAAGRAQDSKTLSWPDFPQYRSLHGCMAASSCNAFQYSRQP